VSTTITPEPPETLFPPRIRLLPRTGPHTIREWVTSERSSQKKHELRNGELVEMSGGSFEHAVIIMDTAVTLSIALAAAGNGCDVVGSDLKVYIRDTAGYYPDVTVVCGEPQIDFEETLRNPAAIIEVLSEGTAAFDRGEKFQNYRTIESLRHYILVDQYQCYVEHYERQETGVWSLVGEYSALEDSLILNLGGAAIQVPLSRVYRRISFGESASPDV
jgi:Uma2 family endonuclease